jgi:copper homeostasis protein
MTIEIVVYNIGSALQAQAGGADRIELCDNPGEGGTTPALGTVETVRQNTTLDVFPMVRPRGGDFCYSNYEFYSMKRDIYHFQKASVDGIVFGILTPDGRIDKKRCKELIDKIRPLQATCHRAFDMTRDPFEALDDCIEVGFDRILTAGQKSKAIDGVDLIARLLQHAAGRIKIMPGSGVNENTVEQIVSTTGVQEIHFSATAMEKSAMAYVNPAIAGMGDDAGSEYLLRTVDAARVRHMRALAEAALALRGK